MSPGTKIPPYFHPTTVCFIDDNYGFTQSLLLTIPDDLYLKSYLSPEEALDEINAGHPRPPLADLCFSKQGSLIQLDLNILEEEIKHIDRFKRISVLLIDYAMPTMNGLDFCAQLNDRDMRRVLLTGVADEKTAVQAFNDGLIDHYLPKAKLSTPGGVVPYIRAQQKLYFAQYHSRLTHALGIAAPPFTIDAVFYDYFNGLLARHGIIEYYLVTDPISFLCLTQTGQAFQLLIQDEAQRAAVQQTLDQYQAPRSLIDAVKRNEVMVSFFEHPEDYLGDEPFPWDEMTFPVTQIHGRETWWCSWVSEAPIDIDFDYEQATYHRFLNEQGQI